MQLKVTNSPFTEEQADLLNRILPSLNEQQRTWLSGFLAATGSAAGGALTADQTLAEVKSVNTESQVAAPATREITILFGSETGNCQALAESLNQKLEEKGFKVVVSALDDFKTKDLKKVEDLLIITATHGEGDPPDNAISFHEFLHGRKAPKLEGVRFSVLALGDLSYEFYCQTGKDFDQRLEELGAERIYPRVDCDVDFDDDAAEWVEGVLGVFGEANQVQAGGQVAQPSTGEAAVATVEYSKNNPFKSEVLENLDLNGRGSNKETRHLELSLEESGLAFEPGDSLGIIPENQAELVDQIISAMDWNSDEPVIVSKKGDSLPLREALINHFEITVLTKPLMEKASQISANDSLKDLVKNEEAMREYMDGRDLLDLIQDFGPWNASESEFVEILRKMPTRLYSIASSHKANPDEVHLTIGAVRYHTHGRDRSGVCSAQVADRVEPGDFLNVYVHKNPNFRMPEDLNAPIIMIGPGTGVAPFRSFLEEREELEAEGKTWLFFGEQHFRSDFLYQVDWQRWLSEGVLTKMDVAFSRDTDEKVYVQHRMLEKSKEFYQWLEEGASVYVCGDEKNMAKDVQETILTILQQEGGLSEEQANDYLAEMRKQKRYQRDVY